MIARRDLVDLANIAVLRDSGPTALGLIGKLKDCAKHFPEALCKTDVRAYLVRVQAPRLFVGFFPFIYWIKISFPYEGRSTPAGSALSRGYTLLSLTCRNSDIPLHTKGCKLFVCSNGVLEAWVRIAAKADARKVHPAQRLVPA